ncbi:MAG: response regulator [Phycisphaerales bacterium]|nr:response regulator [Phycisphaerales bacterium]
MNNRLVRFLLVEDDDDHAELIQMALAENRITNKVERVKDGAEAMDYLRQTGAFAGKPRPDIVLLDLKLPKVDGHEVLQQLKTDESLRTIPVVVMTTSQAEADKVKAYYNHANSYLTKPVDFGRFQKMVKDLKLYWGLWNQVSA